MKKFFEYIDNKENRFWLLVILITFALGSGLLLAAGNKENQDRRTRAETIATVPGSYGYANYQDDVYGGSVSTITPTPIVTLTPAPTSATPTPIPTCPCSLWDASAMPGTISMSETNPVELGVKFRASTSGTISGIRFYKGTINTGVHTGSLWTSSGQLLARATFTNETGSGWQQVNFVTPVAITEGTTYVASYFAPNGGWSRDLNYFTQALIKGPLTGLANGTDGGNGVYIYASVPTFPTSSSQATNYWVDVVFNSGASAPTATSVPPSATPMPSSTPIPTPTPTSIPVPVNLALNKTVNAGSTYSGAYLASYAVDGKVTSYWASGASNRWLTVDLGSSRSISNFTIKHYGAFNSSTLTYNTKAFTIEISSNGASWTRVVSVTKNKSSITTHPISVRTARYVRLNVITPAQNNYRYAQIPEFEVYGY